MCGWCMINVYYSDLTLKWTIGTESHKTWLDSSHSQWTLQNSTSSIWVPYMPTIPTVTENNLDLGASKGWSTSWRGRRGGGRGANGVKPVPLGFVLKQVFCTKLSMFQPLVLFAHVHGETSLTLVSFVLSIVVVARSKQQKTAFLYLHGALKAVRRPGVHEGGWNLVVATSHDELNPMIWIYIPAQQWQIR